MTYRMALTWAVGKGVDASDARWLLQEVARISMTEYLIRKDTAMTAEQVSAFEKMIFRRAAGEPVQHILGCWDFCGLTLKTDPRALIPRPETELLVEEALRLLPEEPRTRVADVGCGTGCIGLAIKSKRHRVQLTLMDISEDARSLAAENARLQHLMAEIVPADMREPLPGAPYDMICSNPPYIPTADCAVLDPVVREHDPMLALDGGTDGLDFYRALADRMRDSLVPGGIMILELGIGEAEAVEALFAPQAERIRLIKDPAGIDRILSLKKLR